MKAAVVYYSMSGNTQWTAEAVARRLQADLIPLQPAKTYPDKGFRKFFFGGKSAVMQETPPLRPYEFHPEQYDLILLGTPVWASNIAPPLRTFLRENGSALQGKRFAAFLCYGGGGAEKALGKMKTLLGGQRLEAQLILVDPRDKPRAENEEKILSFCRTLEEKTS